MKIGDMITIQAKHSDQQGSFLLHARVYQMYDKFCVLDTGKYKTCVFYTDLKGKIPIVV